MATDASPPPARKSPGPQPAAGATEPPEDASPLPAGYIFMCSGATRPECFRYRVLGLPRGRLDAVSRIRRGAALFLYDFHARYLYGPYRADSDGGLALEPTAFEGRYPAQETTSGRAAYGVPHEAAATNLQLVRHYGYAPGSEGATGGTPQSSAEGAASAVDSYPGAPATTQATPSVQAVAAAPAYL